jgi:hypothetical protein
MVLTGRRHQREEEDSGDSHDDHAPQYEANEGFEFEEEGEDNEEGKNLGKDALRPLWGCVTKLEDGRGCGTTKFLCSHNWHKGKPYTGSYTLVRRHLCGVMESDYNKVSIGINVCPNISMEERQKYIKIEEAAQKKHGKKQKLQFDASSRFGGNTFPSPHGSGTSGSRRTIAYFFDIGGRDEVDAKVVRFLYACGIPFNVLCFPYWHDLVKGINEAPKDTRAPTMRKLELCYSTEKKQKFKEL